MKKIVFIIVIGVLLSSSIQGIGLTLRNESNPSSNDDYNMVVVAPETYTQDIQPLIAHKNSLGIKTVFKTTEEIFENYDGRDAAEQIKYFIKTAKEEWQITYVLLIGDAEDIPGRYTHIYFDEPFDYPTPDEWVFPSDFYYADLYDHNGSFSSWDSNQNDVFAEYHWNGNTDEIDLTPDVYIGRLACVNTIQLQNCVNKIISYETQKPWSKEWFSNLVLIAGDGIPFDEEKIDESEYLQEELIDIMQGFIPNRVWASNEKLLDVNNINQAIEQGAGFVFFNGHGNHDLWATYLHESTTMVPPGFYKTNHINQLSNLDRLPIVISDACYHLQYDQYPNCFGWSFVSNPDGGAVAFIGGSDTDLAYAGSRIDEKGIEKLCLKICMLYQQGVSTLGDLWGQGLIEYQPIQDDLVDIIILLQNHLFGDPSLQIAEKKSQPPEKPDPPMGLTDGRINEVYEYTAVTTDPENDDLYYLFDFGDQTDSEWIGPFASGKLCSVNHSWTKKGSYSIRVKAKDSTGLMSEWSDPLSISMPRTHSFYHIFQFIIKILNGFRFIQPQLL